MIRTTTMQNYLRFVVFWKGYELYFNDDYGNLGITYLDPREGFMVYDESTVQKPRYFVTYHIVDEVMRGYIYDKTYKYEFNDKGCLHVFNGVEHGFNDIPATEFIEMKNVCLFLNQHTV